MNMTIETNDNRNDPLFKEEDFIKHFHKVGGCTRGGFKRIQKLKIVYNLVD